MQAQAHLREKKDNARQAAEVSAELDMNFDVWEMSKMFIWLETLWIEILSRMRKNCLRDSANCPGKTTVKTKCFKNVEEFHSVNANATEKEIAKAFTEKCGYIVLPQKAKRVLNAKYGFLRKCIEIL